MVDAADAAMVDLLSEEMAEEAKETKKPKNQQQQKRKPSPTASPTTLI